MSIQSAGPYNEAAGAPSPSLQRFHEVKTHLEPLDNARPMAKALGWFGLALGAAELFVPDQVASVIGIEDSAQNREVLRGLGVREILGSVAIFADHTPRNGIRARVAGDMMDLALLGRAASSRRTDHYRLSFAIVAVVGVTLLDILCSIRLMRS